MQEPNWRDCVRLPFEDCIEHLMSKLYYEYMIYIIYHIDKWEYHTYFLTEGTMEPSFSGIENSSAT